MSWQPKNISRVFALSCFAWASVAQASTSDAWAKLDAESAKACISASGLTKAKISAATHFSDTTGFDVRIVSGTYPQKHMKGASGKMMCLYSRKTKSVEVQELPQ